MKKLILIVLIFSTLSMTKSSYCEGWEEGYKEGWCYQDETCITPVIPVCPVPRIGESTYKDGYNRGFTKGKKDRKE